MTRNLWHLTGQDDGLTRDARGWRVPGAPWWRALLARPELAPVEEACRRERALHARLLAEPAAPVTEAELAALRDPDAQDNYRQFLAFRAPVLTAGTLEGCYLALFRAGPITIAPLFIDLLAQAILAGLLADSADAFEWRAAELLFRPQRVATEDGQVLLGDQEAVDLAQATGGLGDLGRLLIEGGAPMAAAQLQVLGEHNADACLNATRPWRWLLDLGYERTGHGAYALVHPRAGLKALARVLERWTEHLLGVAVRIRPQQAIDDASWRWHLGLDAESSALLNDLYQGQAVPPQRLERLLSLFRLEFDDPAQMRPDLAGKPVYLGLAMNAQRVVRLKPQNLVLNLPLAG